MEGGDDYKFMKINAARKCLNQRVSIAGIVVELGFPNHTNANGCTVIFRIADQSQSAPGLAVMFSAPTVLELPRFASLGDIILLSRVKMRLLKGEMTAVSYKYSSFALFEGKDVEDFLPYQYSPSFQMREQDKNIIKQWLVGDILEEGSLNFTMLRDIKDGQLSSLVCTILHACKYAEDRWFIYVWDGTDTPPCNILAKQDKLPLHLGPDQLPRDILCKFPCVGSVLEVILDKGSEKQAIHLLEPGQPVKLLNIRFQVNAGLWRAVFTPSTRVQYAKNEDNLVLELQRFDRLYGCPDCDDCPLTSLFLSGVDHERPPFVTLLRLLSYPQVTAKFKCVVRVVAAYPWDVKRFHGFDGKYRVLLTLEDATARIRASVFAEHGEKFFGGHPSDEVLIRKRNKLLGLPANANGEEIWDLPRNPPWVQCCIMSFYTDKNNPWETRHYRIFDTWIPD